MRAGRPHSIDACPHHGLAASYSNRYYSCSERRRLGHRVLRRIRDVVDFQIEEDALAARYDLPYDRRAVGHESLQSDLERAGGAVELVGQAENVVARGAVEGHDEPVARLHQTR